MLQDNGNGENLAEFNVRSSNKTKKHPEIFRMLSFLNNIFY